MPFGGRNLRLENLARLETRPPAARLRFAVVGDVQRAFDEARDAVRRLNQVEDLAFVVQVGDFTDLGRAEEFERMAEVFAALEVPWLVVVGNHDLLGNGGNIFDALFGPRDNAFTYQRTRFVLLDTNSREYGFGAGVPDLGWIAEQLAPAPDHDRAVVLSHVWPWSSDFDGEAGVCLSLHGFGSQYFVTSPSRYPSGYYELPTALHAGVALGASAARAIGDGGEREIGLYGEIVALVNELRALSENPSVVRPRDVVSVALGTFVRF